MKIGEMRQMTDEFSIREGGACRTVPVVSKPSKARETSESLQEAC